MPRRPLKTRPLPKGGGLFAVQVEPGLETLVLRGNTGRQRQIGVVMRKRQRFTEKEKQDRTERTSDAARELIEVERAARDAKTARLREQRLTADIPYASSAPRKKRENAGPQ
ncbi:hypothetical protein [Mesorhizobium sp. B2-1-5]|uniref:hypothetical protein n=1 Tax=Mesorhizobium sp. B2-1-5 TaxID=2589969 RepID=UPI00112CEEF8|nr:hypothetical protein [Mesorhizobium sp. B2-1-5]TPM98453.1 hypothetical protein FJ966_10265 [Mesorhizobium sp. B2-1-5]